MSTSTSLRRRPHCHKCGSPMQGHRRKNGLFMCPEGTVVFTESVTNTHKDHSTPLPSPPASPDGLIHASPPPSLGPSRVREKPIFRQPPGKRWHWRNPNWVSPPRKMHLYTPSDGGRESLAPTEPVTESTARHLPPSITRIEEEEEEEEEEGDYFLSWPKDGGGIQSEEGLGYSNVLSPRPRSPISQSFVADTSLNTALRASTPLFRVFRTPREHLDDVRRTVQREGKHIAILNAPLAYRAIKRMPSDIANDVVWVIVSDQVEDLKYALDSQQGGMPGTFFEEPPARSMGFLQVMVAGVMGGLMVAAGLAYL